MADFTLKDGDSIAHTGSSSPRGDAGVSETEPVEDNAEPYERMDSSKRFAVFAPSDLGTFGQQVAAAIFDWVLIGVFFRSLYAVIGLLARWPAGAAILWYRLGASEKRGTTWGMKLFGLELITIKGENPDRAQVLARAFAEGGSIAAFLGGFLPILRNSNRQSLHDNAAGTYLIRKGAVAMMYLPGNLNVETNYLKIALVAFGGYVVAGALGGLISIAVFGVNPYEMNDDPYEHEMQLEAPLDDEFDPEREAEAVPNPESKDSRASAGAVSSPGAFGDDSEDAASRTSFLQESENRAKERQAQNDAITSAYRTYLRATRECKDVGCYIDLTHNLSSKDRTSRLKFVSRSQHEADWQLLNGTSADIEADSIRAFLPDTVLENTEATTKLAGAPRSGSSAGQSITLYWMFEGGQWRLDSGPTIDLSGTTN